MKSDRSETIVTLTLSACCAASSWSLAVTSSATVTVFASDVLETDSERAGWPLVRA